MIEYFRCPNCATLNEYPCLSDRNYDTGLCIDCFYDSPYMSSRSVADSDFSCDTSLAGTRNRNEEYE